MKIFRNKFFFIGLAVLVFLTVLSAVLGGMGRVDLLRDGVMTVTYPVRFVAMKCADAVTGFGKYFGASKAQNEEIASLSAALEEANRKLSEAEVLRAENERLRAYLGVKAAHPEFTFEEATVIGRSTEKSVNVLILDRGSAHGIRANMAVITADGLVGYVAEVGLTWCKVNTVLSEETAVGVVSERSGVLGVLSGKGSGTVMEYIDAGTPTEELPYGVDLSVGDTLVTTGVGVVYPGGLTVGRITSLTFDPYNRRLSAGVQPTADLSGALSFVMILTGMGEETP